ncbi:hypothetical protein [Bradyrhizobium sp. 27S5]|uniref:hypothetical protein n=1 Tax=Bradyrhizobium sp. 27S5 TaxID=3139728 RepID=UPI0030D3F7E7
MMLFRVNHYDQERKRGHALSDDTHQARKIIVEDANVISGVLREGAMIDCDLYPGQRGQQRRVGKSIKVLE